MKKSIQQYHFTKLPLPCIRTIILRGAFSLAFFLACMTVQAAPVVYFTGVYDGAESTTETNEVVQWLNPNLAKTYDGDANDWYGTSGFLHLTVAGSWDGPAAWAGNSGNWGYGGSSAQGRSAYQILSAGANPSSGTMDGAGFTGPTDGIAWSQINARKDYSHVRVAVMNNMVPGYEDNTSITLQIYSGGNMVSEATYNLDSTLNDGKADMYFFDVVGLRAGDGVRVLGDKYSGTFAVDEVTHAGDGQTEFSASFTDTSSRDYISPTGATKTLFHRDNGVFSSIGVETHADDDDSPVKAVTFTNLDRSPTWFLQTTDTNGTTTRGLVIDKSGTAKLVNDLPDFSTLSDMKLVEYTDGISIGNGTILVDFQGVNPTHTEHQRDTNPTTATEGGVWNAFEFQAHNAEGTKDPIMALVDSDGNMTSVQFSMIGNIAGWAGNPGEIDPLKGDYLFNVASGASEQEFTISGLVADAMYELEFFNSSDLSRTTNFTVNGENIKVAPNSSNTWIGSADATGSIMGMFASESTGGEQNWSGMIIRAYDQAAVPEPTTWLLLALGCALIPMLRRKP